MSLFVTLNLVLCVAFLLCYAHRILYVCYTLVKRPKRYPPAPCDRRYAVLICARNEAGVLGYLLDSVADQDYPGDLIDVFVCADNCTDGTAAVARAHGAEVVERYSHRQVGKGYALEALVRHVFREHGREAYHGFLVVDADNLLDPRCITEMHNCICAGARVVTGYRNTKNFGENWLASGYAMWFYHDGRQMNNARTLLGQCATVSGTGFMVRGEVMAAMGGWPYHTLVEDVEFSVAMLLQGEQIVYCHDAVIYDEQPVSFVQSWRQRLRWAKGYHQVLQKYGIALLCGIFTLRGRRFACYDILMSIAPAYLLSAVAVGLHAAVGLWCVLRYPTGAPQFFAGVGIPLLGGYFLLLAAALCLCITERGRIHGTLKQRVVAVLTFPLFMFTFVPVGIVALFMPRVAWKPIRHRVRVTVSDVTESARRGKR